MATPLLEVLYEDNHLLVVNKPAGLPTMGTPTGTPRCSRWPRTISSAAAASPETSTWA